MSTDVLPRIRYTPSLYTLKEIQEKNIHGCCWQGCKIQMYWKYFNQPQNILTSSVASLKPTVLKGIYRCLGFIPVTANKQHNHDNREWNSCQAFVDDIIVYGVLHHAVENTGN